jgi:hypothetical protein
MIKLKISNFLYKVIETTSLKMLHHKHTIDAVTEKYADLGTGYLFNSAGGGNHNINKRLRFAAKNRIYSLIEKRINIKYDKQFTKKENDIIFSLVTKTLLHLSQFS